MCPTKFVSRFFRRNREVEMGYIFDSPTKQNKYDLQFVKVVFILFYTR